MQQKAVVNIQTLGMVYTLRQPDFITLLIAKLWRFSHVSTPLIGLRDLFQAPGTFSVSKMNSKEPIFNSMRIWNLSCVKRYDEDASAFALSDEFPAPLDLEFSRDLECPRSTCEFSTSACQRFKPLCLMSVLVHSCPMTLICQALLRHTRRILCSRAACRVQRSAQAFSSLACSLCGKGGRSQPRAVQGSSASLTICPPWTHRFLCAVVILALVAALRKGLARILWGIGPVLRWVSIVTCLVNLLCNSHVLRQFDGVTSQWSRPWLCCRADLVRSAHRRSARGGGHRSHCGIKSIFFLLLKH